MKKMYLECACDSMDHVGRMCYFQNERDMLYFEIHLNKFGFFKRLRYAVGYLFGKQSRYGAFDELALNVDQVKKLRDELNVFLFKA